MENSEHIFQWARNSQALYLRMLKAINFPTRGKVETAVSIAMSAVIEMRRGGEIRHGEYSANDILDAAKRIVSWDGEE